MAGTLTPALSLPLDAAGDASQCRQHCRTLSRTPTEPVGEASAGDVVLLAPGNDGRAPTGAGPIGLAQGIEDFD